MAYTPVEIIALILIIAAVIKLVVLFIKPKAWMNFAKKLWSKPSITSIVLFALAAIVLYYLIQELTIIQILATTAFVSLLIGMGFAKNIKPLISTYEKQIKKGIVKEYWLLLIVWILLLAWGIKELFF